MLTRHVDMEEGTGDGQADDYAIWALLLLVLLKCRTGGFSVAKHMKKKKGGITTSMT